MRPIHSALPVWLDASVLNHIVAKSSADSFTAGLGTSFTAYTDPNLPWDAVVFTDRWHFVLEGNDTLVSGRLDILLRVAANANIYRCKELLGIFASYIDCIRVKRYRLDEVDIGEIAIPPSEGITLDTKGFVSGQLPIIRGIISCNLTGRLIGV